MQHSTGKNVSPSCGIAPATMKVLMVLLSSFFASTYSGIVTHHSPGVATSYQNFHIQHFQSVPTYIRKEDLHLLEHPVPVGTSGAHIEVHHEGKHGEGYAIEGHGLEEEQAAHVQEDEGQDQGHDYEANQGEQGEHDHYTLLLNEGDYGNEPGGSYSADESESQHLQETSGAHQYQ